MPYTEHEFMGITQIMSESGENQNSKVWLDRLNQDPEDQEAAANLGNYYFDAGDAAQAIVYYTIALQINPSIPGVQTDLGTMYWRNGNLSYAEKNFREVIQNHPDFPTAYLNLGLLLVKGKGQYQEGRALWQTLIEKFIGHPAAARAKELLLETMQ